MTEVLLILSLITSLIAIISAVGAVFYWKGKMDTQMCDLTPLPAMVQGHSFKIDLLWTIFVENTLEGGRLAVRGSPFKLTDEGEECMKDIAAVIEDVRRENPKMGASDVLTLVTQKIGLKELQKLAKKNGCTSGEYLSLLTIKLGIEV